MSSQENHGAAGAEAGAQPFDPVEDLLRGRDTQESFARRVWKRVRDLYPK